MSTSKTLGLDRGSPLPLYAQLKRRLQTMIAGSHHADRFYSDQELCAMFGVSRFTVRQAVQELVDRGLLNRVQGQGTFINTQKSEEAFGPHMDFPSQWARAGQPLIFDLRQFGAIACPEDVATQLGVSIGQPVLRIERLRRTAARLVSYDHRYVHPDFSSIISYEEAINESLVTLLARQCELARVDNRMEATLADAETAPLLGIAPGAAVLVRELVYYAADELPVMAGRSLYPGDGIRHTFSVPLSATEPIDLH